MTNPVQTARLTIVERLMEAYRAQLVTWPRLTEIAYDARHSLAAATPAIELPTNFRRQVVAAGPATPQDPALLADLRALRRAMILIAEIGAYGPLEALALCTDETASLPDANRVFTRLGRLLDDAQIDRRLSDAGLSYIEAQRLPSADRPDVLLGVLALLGLSKTAAFGERRLTFERVALPRMHRAALADDVDQLLSIENMLYDSYINTIETPEHHATAFAAMEQAYEHLSPQPAPSVIKPAPDGSPKVAFLIPNGDIYAHTEVLLAFLDNLKQLPQPAIEPLVVIHFNSEGGELGRRLDELGVAWIAIGVRDRLAFRSHLDAVSQAIAAQGCDSVVFVSLPLLLTYFTRRPLAAIQIWWSMKFALPNFDGLQGRVFYRSLFDRKLKIEGREWRGGPLAFKTPKAPDPGTVASIRARFPGKIILGTIAREQKIANDDYLAAVVGVLQRHPDTVFLWTGRNELRQIVETFARAGVDNRCHFIGWVDPVPYIAAFDVFLETYPLTGLMSGWAMALGKPVISVGSLGFLGTYLEPVLDGSISTEPGEVERIDDIFASVRARLPGLWARHPHEIGAFADALLADPGLMAALGEAQRRYVSAYLADELASADVQAKHFAAIAEDARASLLSVQRPARP